MSTTEQLDNGDLLDPNNSPTKQTKVGVKTVNNLPLILMFVGIGVFILIISLVAADRAEQQEKRMNPTADSQERIAGDTTMQANAIIQGREQGFTPAKEIVEQQESLDDGLNSESTDVNNEEKLDPEVQAIMAKTSSLPPKRDSAEENYLSELKRQMTQEKLRSLQNAVQKNSNVQISSSGSQHNFSGLSLSQDNSRAGKLSQLDELNRKLESTKAMLASNPIEQYQQTLAQIQNAGLVSGGSSNPIMASQSTPMAITNNEPSISNDYEQFNGNKSRWDLNSTTDIPKSPYQLHAGFVLPAIMITGVNSDLAGQIMGQVSQNIYDSVTGEHLLIPQGSRLVGTYSSNVAFGQERVMVAWQRILFPDGKSLDIGSMQGADSAGYSGFKDKVNHHFWRIFSSALMMSVITAAAELSQDDNDSSRERSALNEALGQNLGQAAAQMIMRNLNIAPTIEIRSGYRFNVMVSKDIVFNRPYQSYDY